MAKGINPETGRHYRYVDRTGTRNGRLTFIKEDRVDRHRRVYWLAVCDCGRATITATPSKTQSCGCLQREAAGEAQKAKRLPPELKRLSVLQNRKNQRERRRSDPVKAMQARLSRLHRHALSQVNAIKTSPTFEALGYTAKEFCEHIERQFSAGMGWHNMHMWQIDHITPISEARTEEDVFVLNQLSNLRPLWAKENNAKKNKRQLLL